MKKKFFANTILIIFILGLAGCGKEPEKEKKEAKEELLLWSYYETEAQKEGLDKLVGGFNGSQNQYRISWEYVPMVDFVKRLSIALSSDRLPDLVLLDNTDMESLIKSGLLEDVTEQLQSRVFVDNYYEEVWDSVEYGGRYYGVPFGCNNTVILYNKQMFREAGVSVPVTWEQFLKAAKALGKTEGEPQYGFAMSAFSGEQGASQFMPWIFATGATEENLADERTIHAFELLEELLESGSMPHDCMNWSQNDITRVFVERKVAMIENGPWALPEIEASGIDYGIFSFPAYVTQGVIVGGENLAVIQGKNVDGAIAFMDYYNQDDVMGEISEIMWNIPPKKELAKAYGKRNENMEVFVSQMEEGTSRTSVPNWKEVRIALSESLYQSFGSEFSAEDIWKGYIAAIGSK
ncbi:MAG: extracellular solute-binding protein [Lachnospiraceae bacterium]|jgi:multiple sugar transport system substrate-binding protein|nr:extracellular solute-binding protein [Lachnospiraceae bacterium]